MSDLMSSSCGNLISNSVTAHIRSAFISHEIVFACPDFAPTGGTERDRSTRVGLNEIRLYSTISRSHNNFRCYSDSDGSALSCAVCVRLAFRPIQSAHSYSCICDTVLYPYIMYANRYRTEPVEYEELNSCTFCCTFRFPGEWLSRTLPEDRPHDYLIGSTRLDSSGWDRRISQSRGPSN